MRTMIAAALIFIAMPASAGYLCGDGHVSHARRHSGACSHHGGVASFARHGERVPYGEGPTYWGSPTYQENPPGMRFYGDIGSVHYGY